MDLDISFDFNRQPSPLLPAFLIFDALFPDASVVKAWIWRIMSENLHLGCELRPLETGSRKMKLQYIQGVSRL
jgi:hypothetical protein